ncbi:Crp/Fnr family transcriptional regulator [Sulfurimonas paralvinellae]|uniref:Crp/Fnr family transcriptional regulator n=1 Tax=Sulfurimonas paralvinellae TaxID=317658 RepID=A0A7M1BCM5_9BACT|nr:Crp/Fnr family transcriptional regulator [Sulfurimonas paralvinellae]QOP46532.1 Crp/Fnr family transcriptional regulator [Sulfurimonas paralvinellae]
MSLKDAIKSLDFFSRLDDEQIHDIASFATLHHYEKEYILYYEQEELSELYFLVDGLAKSYKLDKHDNEIFLYYIYKNSMISEISDLQTDTLFSFSNVSIIEDAQVVKIKYKKFKEHFLDKGVLCREFTNAVVERSLQMQSLISREFIFDAVSKVSMMLREDLEMFNKLKRHDISLMLHIQPATLSRVLNRLKRNNIIDIIHGEVAVLDTKALEEIYKDINDE